MIKNLCPGLMEVGKIKIGKKGDKRKSANGEWQLPQKLDHFIVTTMERGEDNNFIPDEKMHKTIGVAPKEIPVRLLYDDPDLNFPTRYSCYYGKKLYCHGDGETAQRLQSNDSNDREEITCPCHRQDPTWTGEDGKGKGKCKINGVLSVLIDCAERVGGVWKFRTTGYNTTVGILSSMALIKRVTGGRLAGVPLLMTVSPKTTTDPVKGGVVTVYVVGLQYLGTMDALRGIGYQIALDETQHGIKVAEIENEARRLLTYEIDNNADDALGSDTAEDITDEFYPEEGRPATPALVRPESSKAESVAESTATNEVGGPEAMPALSNPIRRSKKVAEPVEAVVAEDVEVERQEEEQATEPSVVAPAITGPVSLF